MTFLARYPIPSDVARPEGLCEEVIGKLAALGVGFGFGQDFVQFVPQLAQLCVAAAGSIKVPLIILQGDRAVQLMLMPSRDRFSV